MISDLIPTEAVRLVTVVASIAASLPILFYRCQGRYKFSISLLAWALAFFMIAQAISAAFVSESSPAIYQAGITSVMAFLIWRSRGNVSKLMRCD